MPRKKAKLETPCKSCEHRVSSRVFSYCKKNNQVLDAFMQRHERPYNCPLKQENKK